MKASIVSKLIIILCVLCLIAGFYRIDKDSPYMDNAKNKSTNSKSLITTANKIGVIELEGPIASSYESNLFSKETNAPTLLKSLISAQSDKELKGVIIKINSPGGTVAMSQNIYNQIIKLRKEKPVVVSIDDIAASGGYYIACAADRIVAQDGSLTGSIGVIFSLMDYHNLLINKLSVSPIVIKSGKYKDIGSGLREMTADEKALMQDIVDDSYSQFLEAIEKGRINRDDNYSILRKKLHKDTLVEKADGRVFTGRQAYQLGFVDKLGDLDTATEMIEKMAQEKFKNKLPAKLVIYNKKSTFGEYFSTLTEYNAKSQFSINNFIPTSMILSRKPLYLWE